jgi:hypothetical protein
VPCFIYVMTKTIAGFFKNRSEGETACRKLLDSGFTSDEVSFVSGDTEGHEIPALGPIPGTGADSEVPEDASLGSVIGLAAGLVLLVVPGVGPFLAIGPLAAAMGGVAAGAAVGGLVGLLRDHGVSKEEAEFYEEGIRRGGSLVTVRGVSEEREKKAREIMQKSGSIETEELKAMPSETA